MGVKFDLILVLRSQFFDFLRETSYKHALEHLEAAGPEKKWVIFFFRKCLPYLLLTSWRSVICRDTFSVLAPVLRYRSLTKKWPCYPLPLLLFMTASMIPYTLVCHIRVANACGIRGWRNLGYRPMTMETRCSKVIFPNYSQKKPAEDTLVPPLWGTREENVCFPRIICSRCCTRRNLRFHVENSQHADQKQLTRR